MALTADDKQGILLGFLLRAQASGRTILDLLNAQVLELTESGYLRTPVAVSGSGTSSSSTGIENTEYLGLLRLFIRVLKQHESSAAGNQETLFDLMCADDRLNGARSIRPDFSNYGA